jgi:hypothetical protein
MNEISNVVQPYIPYSSNCGYCHNQSQTSFLAASLYASRMTCSVWLPLSSSAWGKDVLLTRQVREREPNPRIIQYNTRLATGNWQPMRTTTKRCIRE